MTRIVAQCAATTGATDRAIASTRLSAMASPISMKPTGSSPAAWQVARWRQKAKKLMARAVTITPPPRYLLPDEARAFVDAMYAAHGYSNVVLVRG